jgi:hypothetical protein
MNTYGKGKYRVWLKKEKVCGVHVDNASKDEIELLVASWKKLIKCI